MRPCRTRWLVAAGWALAVTLCLGTGLLLVFPGPAQAISGYAGGSTAVAAQYQDSPAAQPPGQKPDVSNLAQVIHATSPLRQGDSPKVQASTRKVVHRELEALSSGASNLRQTGSIAVLIAAIAVVLVGGVLRWRRVDEEPR